MSLSPASAFVIELESKWINKINQKFDPLVNNIKEYIDKKFETDGATAVSNQTRKSIHEPQPDPTFSQDDLTTNRMLNETLKQNPSDRRGDRHKRRRNWSHSSVNYPTIKPIIIPALSDVSTYKRLKVQPEPGVRPQHQPVLKAALRTQTTLVQY